jgi:hypothetical protein
MAVVMKTRMMLTSVDQDRVNTGVALALVSKSTVTRRARPSVSPEAIRKATARSSAMARSPATVVVRKNPMAVKNHLGTDVRNTAVTLEATADSNRSMVLTLIALVDTVVKKSLDMGVKSTLANLITRTTVARSLLVLVLTLTDLVDMAVRKVGNTVVSVLIRPTAPLVFLADLVRRLKAMVVAVTKMKMNTAKGDRSLVQAAMVVQVDMVRRVMEGGTRYEVFCAGSQCGLGLY